MKAPFVQDRPFFDISIEINRIVCYNNKYTDCEHLWRTMTLFIAFAFSKQRKDLQNK